MREIVLSLASTRMRQRSKHPLALGFNFCLPVTNVTTFLWTFRERSNFSCYQRYFAVCTMRFYNFCDVTLETFYSLILEGGVGKPPELLDLNL